MRIGGVRGVSQRVSFGICVSTGISQDGQGVFVSELGHVRAGEM